MSYFIYSSLEKFATEYIERFDLLNTVCCIISEDIKCKKSKAKRKRGTSSYDYEYKSMYENVEFFNHLKPKGRYTQYLFDDDDFSKKSFYENYKVYLRQPENFNDICCIIDLFANHGANIIILVSNREYDMDYIGKGIRPFIYSFFELDILSWDEFVENDMEQKFDLDKIKKLLDYQINLMFYKDSYDVINNENASRFYNPYNDNLHNTYFKILNEMGISDIKEIVIDKDIIKSRLKLQEYNKNELIKLILESLDKEMKTDDGE